MGVEGFSLLEALDEGFFSDLVVKACDGSPFNVHRMVLGLCGMSYRDWEIFISSLKPTTAKAVLTYLYTDSLPPSLPVTDAKELLSLTSVRPKLSPLATLLKTFIASHNLKQRMSRITLCVLLCSTVFYCVLLCCTPPPPPPPPRVDPAGG